MILLGCFDGVYEHHQTHAVFMVSAPASGFSHASCVPIVRQEVARLAGAQTVGQVFREGFLEGEVLG